MFAVVEDGIALVNAALVPGGVVLLTPVLSLGMVRGRALVDEILLVVRVVDLAINVIRQPIDRRVRVPLRDVIKAGLRVRRAVNRVGRRVIRLRLDRLGNLRHVVLLMDRLVRGFLIDLQQEPERSLFYSIRECILGKIILCLEKQFFWDCTFKILNF